MKASNDKCQLVSIASAVLPGLHFWIKRREPKTASWVITPLIQSVFQLPLSRRDLLKWVSPSQRSW